MANIQIFCFLASYAVAFALEMTRLLRRSTINRAVMLLFGTAGFVAHTSYLWNRSGEMGLPPLLSSTQDWMLVLAWVAILLYLFFTTVDRELAIGLFLLPLVLILVVAAYFVSAETSELVTDSGAQQAGTLRLAMSHASFLVFGIAGIIVGFVLSTMYLFQHRRLKHKQVMQDGLALPSLARLARWNWWAVMISFPLLTLGMGTGIWLSALSPEVTVPVALTDPVVVVNIGLWLIMVGLFVWLAVNRHSTGKQVAWRTLWAFGFLLVTVVALQMLTRGGLDSFHSQIRMSCGVVAA